jgi:hypothetical protein
MIWGEMVEARILRITTPHRWFAWRPVWLLDGRIAWLQYVERRARIGEVTYHEWWEYDEVTA